MKTDIHEAPISSLIVLFVILVIGGGFYIYPQDITGIKNEATPSSLTGNENPNSNFIMVTDVVSTTTSTGENVQSTTSVKIQTGPTLP